jgi:hypothetical protein
MPSHYIYQIHFKACIIDLDAPWVKRPTWPFVRVRWVPANSENLYMYYRVDTLQNAVHWHLLFCPQ